MSAYVLDLHPAAAGSVRPTQEVREDDRKETRKMSAGEHRGKGPETKKKEERFLLVEINKSHLNDDWRSGIYIFIKNWRRIPSRATGPAGVQQQGGRRCCCRSPSKNTGYLTDPVRTPPGSRSSSSRLRP